LGRQGFSKNNRYIMCGIAGTYNFSSKELVEKMSQTIRHRGPDDEGFAFFENACFGFRRLSIIDLKTGSQPMSSEDGSVWVIFNGEIYNYKELKLELSSHFFKTRSDTEVMVHLYEEFGEDFVSKLNGQFAIALYDKKTKKLILARDRLGIKPVYYAKANNDLLFASEIKAILRDKRIKREPNITGINNFLSLRYVPGQESCFKGIFRLPPASLMVCSGSSFEIKKYWKPEVFEGKYEKDDYYLDRFSELFEDSVKMRLMSDVPLGVYLSGGLDSSCVAACMKKFGPVRAFSIGFGTKYDELDQAEERASQIGLELDSFNFSPQDFSLLAKIIYHMDEPQGDAIMLPAYLLSQQASSKIKVALTGEGADEILGGYLYHKTIKLFHSHPFLAKMAKPAVSLFPGFLLDLFFDHPASLGSEGKKRLLKYLELVKKGDMGSEYIFLSSLFDNREMCTDYFKSQVKSEIKYKGDSFEDLLAMQYDYWLPDNVLMRQDKMSMANSLEVRVPFLDHRLVEFLLRTPSHLKVRNLTDKYLLRKYSLKVLPKKVSKIKKMPFYIPIENYFKGQGFKELINLTLSQKRVEKRGYFKYNYIRDLLEKLNENEFLYAKQVMALIILELWHQIFIDNESFNNFLSV
jgi:asparagine synthase (glutamine-hydrolysing)